MKALIPFPDISPVIFSFEVFGYELALRWYALAYIVGILIGWRLVIMAVNKAQLWRHDTPPLTKAQVEDLVTWVILGVILGGRLGYVLFYKPAFYFANPVEILMITEGGMAFHGGLLGVIAACFYTARKYKAPFWSVADILCMATPAGLLLGRIANFINAELWGRPTDLPWGVAFPGQAAQYCPGIEGLCARHPSQLYEAALEGLILGTILLYLVWRRGALKFPARVTGMFFAGYGISRFIVEYFRQADAQFMGPGNPMGYVIRFGEYGLQMGQILSLPMILFGLALILWSRRA